MRPVRSPYHAPGKSFVQALNHRIHVIERGLHTKPIVPRCFYPRTLITEHKKRLYIRLPAMIKPHTGQMIEHYRYAPIELSVTYPAILRRP